MNTCVLFRALNTPASPLRSSDLDPAQGYGVHAELGESETVRDLYKEGERCLLLIGVTHHTHATPLCAGLQDPCESADEPPPCRG